MAWPTPKYSKSQVNKAGKILVENPVLDENTSWAFDAVNQWRASHGYPINTFQVSLRDKLKIVDPKAIVAQRLKRLPSIISKLKRHESMQLSRMQDFGGLRAVVSNLRRVRLIQNNYINSAFDHKLVHFKDYIAHPKPSGYRSVHLVYKYKSRQAPEYDGLFVELQIRTAMQHAWATAVETVGTFLDQSLKSSQGPGDWLDFFSVSSSAFAHMEKAPPVPGYEPLTREETFSAVLKKGSELNVRERLLAFTVALDKINQDPGRGAFHLVLLDLKESAVTIRSYSQANLDKANKEYADAEKKISRGDKIQAVLVSAGPLENLRRAYPNYFLDAMEFIKVFDRIKIESEEKTKV